MIDKILNRLPLQDKVLFMTWTGGKDCKGLSQTKVAGIFGMSYSICGAIIDRIVREFNHPALAADLRDSDPRILRAVKDRLDEMTGVRA